MNYLDLLTEIFNLLVALGQAIAEYGPSVVSGVDTIWADLQSAWETISAAINGNTTLSDDQVAAIKATISNTKGVLDAAGKAKG